MSGAGSALATPVLPERMQASIGFAAFLNPFATQPTGQGEESGMGGASGLAGLDVGLFGVEGEDADQDSAFAGLLNEAMAAVAGVVPPLQPQATPAAKMDGAAVEAALFGAAPAAIPAAIAPGLDLTAIEDGAAQPVVVDGESSFASALGSLPVDVAPTDAPKAVSPFVGAEPASSVSAPSTPSTPSPAAPPVQAAAAVDAVAVAAVAQAPAEQQTQAEVKASQPTPQAQAAATAQAATVLAAAAPPPAPVKTAAEPVKAAAKDKAAPAEDARPASGSAAFHPVQAAKSVQEAVTELAVTPPEAFEGEDAPLAADAPEAPEAPVLQSAATTPDVRSQGPLGEPARVTTQTVAHLATQIAQKLDGKTTRFDVQLNPHGLGSVDVRVEIGPRGDITAALSFDNPQAAAELRGRTGELQAALEQAGFDASKTTLSFNSGGQGQQQGLWDQNQQASQGRVWQSRAFTDLSDTPEAAPAPVRRRATSGVDVRI